MRERPTGTAISIALSLLSLRARRDAGDLVDARDAEMLGGAMREIGGVVRVLAAMAQRRWASPLGRFIEWCIVPGIMRHFGVRKLLIQEAVEHAVAHGVTRVVVLGAGLDLLAARLARRDAGTELIEVDRAETIGFKRRMRIARA